MAQFQYDVFEIIDILDLDVWNVVIILALRCLFNPIRNYFQNMLRFVFVLILFSPFHQIKTR